MNKLSSASYGSSSVPMNLFATWEVDRSSPQCVPRVCSLALGKLIITRQLDRDVQSVFVAVKMQGSKRVLRSNEILLPANGLLTTDLELTFSLQYPHFIKREENSLQIMLQRKKRYKNRAMLGYKTLAVGSIDMAQVIQNPISDMSILDLISTIKDRRNSVVVAAQVVVSSVNSVPTDEGESGRSGKHLETDRSPDVDNYTDDDDASLSSDNEIGSDVNPQELYIDDEGNHKHKERRKIRMTSSSRQQNFIKAKLLAVLRKFKQAEDEGLEPDLVPDPDNNISRQVVDLDLLYDEIEDLNLSDSCPEVEDNISIVSTPKPKLRPFFDCTSYSSSQTEISSLRDQHSLEQADANYADTKDSTVERSHSNRETFRSLRDSDKTPAIDQSDNSDLDEDTHILHPSLPRNDINLADHSGSDPESPGQQQSYSSGFAAKRRKRSWPRSRSPSFGHIGERVVDTTSSNDELDGSLIQQSQPIVIHGSFPLHEDEDSECNLPNSLLLINRAEGNGRKLVEAVRSCYCSSSLNDVVVLATNSLEDLDLVMNALMLKLQKFINNNSLQPTRVKIGVAGGEPYLNHIIQKFVLLLSSRSPDWLNYFLFLPVPLSKHRLSQYLSSIDVRYAKLFVDQKWRDFFDKSCHTNKTLATSSQHDSSETQPGPEVSIVRRVLEYIDQSSAVLPVVIAEAMLTFAQKSDSEDCSQKFIPFITEARVGENEVTSQQDSDKEDLACGSSAVVSGSNVISATSSYHHSVSTGTIATPTSPSFVGGTQHSFTPALAELKMGLMVDYWKDKDATKYTLKTTFKSFHVSRLPVLAEHTSGLALHVVMIGKKNIMRLPGKKGKEKEMESKAQIIGSINRLICTSKQQNNLLKVKIDGIEWKEIKFFQLSSHWSSHVKTFPVGLFSASSS